MGKGEHNNSNGGGNDMKMKIMMMKRGMRCSYGFMLLLGFGIAVFGAMFLHKFRERRLFHLIIKEKDEQLFSLNLILKNEKYYIKENQRKTEEMRAKIYLLRTQMKNLASTILEMRSTISSMKDDQRTLEMALEEKQTEINQLTKRQLDYIKLTPLTDDTLSQKEAGTEGLNLKQHIDQQVKVWSVSADDPSNPKVNITEAGVSKEMAMEVVDYIDASRNESSSKIDEAKSIGNEEHVQKPERVSEESMSNETSTIDHSQGENSKNSQVEGSSNVDGKEVNTLNGPGGYKSSVVEVGKSRDSDGGKDGHLEVRESLIESENEKSGVKYRGGIKLQMADKEVLRVKNSNRKKAKGKKLGFAKHRMLESRRGSEISALRIGGRRFGKGALESGRNNKIQEDGGNTKADQPVEGGQEKEIEQIISEKHYISSEKDEVPGDLEAEDLHEPDSVTWRESSSNLKDDKEEYKDETDESDF